MAENGVEEVEVSAGDKKLKLRGSDLLTSVIGMIVCSGIVLLGYILFEHKTDARDQGSAFVSVIKEINVTAKDSLVAQRVMNCLLASDQKDREAKLPVCERLAK